MITADKIKGKILYEDALCFAYLPDDATTLGHIHIVPKEPVQTLEDCSEELTIQLFYVASYAATAVYEGLGAHGTNIICNNGTGQLVLEVLPRQENDGIELKWEPKKQDDLDATATEIMNKADVLAAGGSTQSVQSAGPQPVQQPAGPDQTSMKATEEDNYMIKHLYRHP
jgi:histidine triad (HIT) family protein